MSKFENSFRFILTNARSLTPKIDSLLDMFGEMQLSFAAISETWFKGGRQLEGELSDIEQAAGIKFLCRNRDGRSKQRGGGVAIAFRASACNFKERRVKRSGKAEILCAVGTVGEIKRRVVIFAMYLPPTMSTQELDALTESLATEIAATKVALGDPIIIVCGDMNGRQIQEAFDINHSIELVPSGPTRGTSTLDLVFTNVRDMCRRVSVHPPLETKTGTLSDHRCVMVEVAVQQTKEFTWIKKTTRKRTESADERFAEDLGITDWGSLPADPDDALGVFESVIQSSTDSHFPLISVRQRSNEDPWITNGIRRRAKKKRRLYRRRGRTAAWKKADADLQADISEKRQEFVEKLLQDPGKNYYRAVKQLGHLNRRRNGPSGTSSLATPPNLQERKYLITSPTSVVMAIQRSCLRRRLLDRPTLDSVLSTGWTMGSASGSCEL